MNEDRMRFEELKDAYALGALPEDERRWFESYLDTHPELRPEVEELTAIANLLAFAPGEYEPSPDLRRSIMETVEAESSGSTDTGALRSRIPGLFRLRRAALAAAALVVAGLISWNVLLQAENQDLKGEARDLEARVRDLQSEDRNGSTTEMAVYRMSGSGEASGEVVRMDDGRAILVADKVPSIPEGKTFQIWVIKNGVPKPAGLFEPEGDTNAATVRESLRGADAVAITVEPDGGSPSPTSEPFLSANLGDETAVSFISRASG
jgi:anti-sigma-K factor RskA